MVRRLSWLGIAIIVLLSVLPLSRFFDTASFWLNYPYPRSGTEGLTLYETLIVKHGGNVYDPITADRFISAPYPPVYYRLASYALPDELPDFSRPDAIFSFFQSGRLISLLAALLTAALIMLLVSYDSAGSTQRKHFTFPALVGGLSGGVVWLTLPPVLVWSLVFRSDMLMIGFTAAGLVCVAAGAGLSRGNTNYRLRITDYEPTRLSAHPHGGEGVEGSAPSGAGRLSSSGTQIMLLSLGAAFFALASFTKQTAFPGPLAAGAYLMLRDWRSGLRWCALMGVLVIVPFAALDISTNHWFYLKLVDFHSLPLRLSILLRLLRFALLEDQWPLLIIGAGYTIYIMARWWKGRGTGHGKPSLVAIFMVASAATLPTWAVVGADHNHLLMPGLAICAATGSATTLLLRALGDAQFRESKFKWALPVVGVVGVLLAVYLIATSPPSSLYDVNLEVPRADYQEQMRKIIDNVASHPGQIFFSDSAGILALAGKETPYDDPFTMNVLSQQGRWDETGLRNMLREGKFGLLVLSCDVINTTKTCQFTPDVIDAIRDGYTVIFKDILFTYAPKQ